MSILQDVTLGGTGTHRGKRHPTIRTGVMIGAGAQIFGPVEIGAYSKIAAGFAGDDGSAGAFDGGRHAGPHHPRRGAGESGPQHGSDANRAGLYCVYLGNLVSALAWQSNIERADRIPARPFFIPASSSAEEVRQPQRGGGHVGDDHQN